MTQFEVPQISLQRYVELLKRRRWQVIPVSVMGLLVGGLVAFFIPRYYVADAVIQHQRVPGLLDSRNPEDPLRSIVDTARMTIPQSAGDAMAKLNWPEIAVSDLYQRTQNERAVQSRLVVFDLNANQARDRDWAQIQVTYRDQDGQRSSAFVNTLVETWITKRINDLRVPVELRRAQHTNEANRHRVTWDRLRDELQELEVLYGIDPRYAIPEQRLQFARQQEFQQGVRASLEAKVSQREAARRQQAADQEALSRVERRIKPDDSVLLLAAKASPEGLQLLLTIKYYREQEEGTWHDGSPEMAKAKRARERYEAKLHELVSGTEADADGLVANPAHKAMVTKIEADEKALAQLDEEIVPLQAKVEAETRRLARLPLGFTSYQNKQIYLDEAKASLDAANAALRGDDEILAQLQNVRTVEFVRRANPPPRPTEPNILVVALIGCALGLGIAIGLILLLDVMQGSFKTIDDVERGLPVPVLGGVSHLETEADRQHTLASRRRVSLTAAAFVGLCVIVITIFYIDPTRLPSFVRDILVMLLGA